MAAITDPADYYQIGPIYKAHELIKEISSAY